MLPKIKDAQSWQQAELLMQPAFIRLIDNIRRQLDESDWRGTYHEVPLWPADTSEETKAIVLQLQQELANATPEQAEDIQETLSRLPTPHPGYHLCLQRRDQTVNVDLWQLCYQICFCNYHPLLNVLGNQAVEIDMRLLEADTGEVDWEQLDQKTRQLVEGIFASLPK